MNETFRSLKEKVRLYWDAQACGTASPHAKGLTRYSKEYFDCIEAERYAREPEIFSFAQFTRYRGKKILEVGIGAGTDFVQWVRAGARAYGVDLTEEAVEHVRTRLALEGLSAEDIRIGDAEELPYDDAVFDLVYSWGVLHHSPDTYKALTEVIRVCQRGGVGKIMLYHRYSLVTFFLWMRRALLMGRPWKSFAWCLSRYMESPGTKAFTVGEIRRFLTAFPLEDIRIRPILTYYDVEAWEHPWLRFFSRILAYFFGNHVGWFLLIEFRKRL